MGGYQVSRLSERGKILRRKDLVAQDRQAVNLPGTEQGLVTANVTLQSDMGPDGAIGVPL